MIKTLNIEKSTLEKITAFYFLFDSKQVIVEASQAIKKACPKIDSHQTVSNLFQIVVSESMPDNVLIPEEMIIIKYKANGFKFKGQVILLPSESYTIFVGSPVVEHLEELTAKGISLSDFCIHDTLFDYLMLVHTTEQALIESSHFEKELTTKTEQEKYGPAGIPSESPFPILRIDFNGYLNYFNAAAMPIVYVWNCQKGSLVPPLEQEVIQTVLKTNEIQRQEILSSNQIFLLEFVFNKKSQSIDVFGMDITEKRAAERLALEQRMQLISTNRLSEIGKMAAEIMHEIGTPLAIITSYSNQIQEIVKEELSNLPVIIDMAQSIEKSALRISSVMQGMRRLAREGKKDPFISTSLQLIINETIALCRQKIKNHEISLKTTVISDQLLIECRPSQISQVLINLINNACDAVETLNMKWIEIDIKEKEEHIEISVIDSGAGIPQSYRSNLFDQFFTTKEVGKGTGLGLGISRTLIMEHGGTLTLDETSLNTRFVILLPKNKSKSSSIQVAA